MYSSGRTAERTCSARLLRKIGDLARGAIEGKRIAGAGCDDENSVPSQEVL